MEACGKSAGDGPDHRTSVPHLLETAQTSRARTTQTKTGCRCGSPRFPPAPGRVRTDDPLCRRSCVRQAFVRVSDPTSAAARGLGNNGRATSARSAYGSPTEPMRIIGPRPVLRCCSCSSLLPHVECSRLEGCCWRRSDTSVFLLRSRPVPRGGGIKRPREPRSRACDRAGGGYDGRRWPSCRARRAAAGAFLALVVLSQPLGSESRTTLCQAE